MCEKNCPVMNPPIPHRNVEDITCQSVYSLDMASRAKSTSGGVFFELAKKTIEEGGVVCGCVWDDQFVARHVCTDDISVLEKMRGSKYVQSDLGNCIAQMQSLSKTRKVLFCGLPCQATAVSRCIRNRENLTICSLICGGAPSPEVWRQYKEHLEAQQGSKLTAVQHRSKKKKWLVGNMLFTFENGKTISEVIMQNVYGANYYKGLTINEACFECGFKAGSLDVDLILGDHWDLDKKMLRASENMGVSTVIALTAKGQAALDAVSDRMASCPGDIHCVLTANPSLVEKHQRNSKRDLFFSQLHSMDIAANLSANMPDVTHSRARKILYRLGIYTPAFTLIWKLRHK